LTFNQKPTDAMPAPQQLTLGPADKFIAIVVDPFTGTVQTIPQNLADLVEIVSILTAALASAVNELQKQHEKKESRILTLPTGSSIRPG